ncbi:MAG: endonuclease MutS2 [Oscillospiraceae bacterium]|nr:endonuclease MutS2 [Oscillospiraceae bacterium]
MENRKTYKTRLDFDKVLERVADLAVSTESREKIRDSEPYTDPARVASELHLTDSLMDILERGHNPGISSQDDIPAIALRAEKGGVLFMGELLHVARALENARRLRDWYQPAEEKAYYGDYLFFDLYSDNGLERQIRDAILSDTEMADEASPALADIRRRIMRQESSIRDKLDAIIRSSSTSKYLQEAIVTMRGGRFVVPVKLENRNAISGLVHDVSSSGSTVFVEPSAVVEANNRIMQLKAEEQAEIDRILAAFSARVQNISSSLVKSHRAFILIDIALAKARYALSINAVMPDVNDRGYIDLRRARHPLIDRNTVVPIDVRLGREFTTLVITGPNTGGKTVSLKTVGLLTVMACCGIPIPVAPGSEVAVFGRILADIGDEQSIEQSLSTFSSHITNVIEILKVADSNSLVLLDELGAGTDPEEGAALAEAILERLRKLGCRVFATTHYAEIKLYAMQTEGVTNASCEFDVQTLSPTYHLSIGVPGRSNALLICERLGLDSDVIEDARYGMAIEDRRFEDAISEIDALRADLNDKEREIEEIKAEAKAELEKARSDADGIRKKAEKELEYARNRAKQMSADVAAGAYKLMDELRKLEADDDRTRKEKLARAKQIANNDSVKLADYDEKILSAPDELPKVGKVRKGDTVYVMALGGPATVLSGPDDRNMVELQSGLIKTRAKLDDLRQLPDRPMPKPKKTYSVQKTIAKETDGPRTELDLRGKTVEEAIAELEGFVDRALLSHISILYVIHGKGTGALRQAVNDWLRRCPQVRSHRLGQYGEGDSGVTVVELK